MDTFNLLTDKVALLKDFTDKKQKNVSEATKSVFICVYP